MADKINLTTYVLTGLFALFLIVGMTSFVLDAAEEHNTELDDYMLNANTNYTDRITTQKNKAQNLQNDSLSLDPDTDSNDIEGSFIIKGWRTARNMISSLNQLVKSSMDLIRDGFAELKVSGWILKLLLTVFLVGLVLIVLKITVERKGVS